MTVIVDRKNKVEKQTMELFESAPFYMVRSSILSTNLYDKIFNGSLDKLSKSETINWMHELSKDPLIKEAIAASSMSLYESLENIEEIKNKKRYNQVLHSFKNYLIRMTTRATPFGLLSGVSSGSFGEGTRLCFSLATNHSKRTRPDMEWILAVIKLLEDDHHVLSQLHLQRNNTITYAGSRVEIPYVTQYGQQKLGKALNFESVSIRKTPVVEYVLDVAMEPVHFQQLQTMIQTKYPNAPLEKIQNLLFQLVEQEFLMTELRPPLMDTQPFEYLINQLNNIQHMESTKEQLHVIQSLIEKYNKLQIGEGLSTFLQLDRKMKELVETKSTLQIDVKLDHQGEVKLPTTVGEEVAKVSEMLWRMSPTHTDFAHLVEYRRDFIEKYGTYREVPLLELLDEDKGLGAPALYQNPRSRRDLPKERHNLAETKREQYIMLKFLEAIKKNELEVEISFEEMEALEPETPNKNSAPDSLELYGTIIAETKESIDHNDFTMVLGPNPGSNAAGKTFGRFLDLYEHSFLQSFHKMKKEIENNDEGEVYAELVYLPVAGRAANVTLSKNVRDYEIVIGTNSSKSKDYTISLSDLVVGATVDRFYIKSKRLNKEIMITVGHMLNVNGSPNIYRFLTEVTSEGKRHWNPFNWYSLDSSPFLPRLKFSKTVISPARWKINHHLINTNKNTAYEKWRDRFLQWAKLWNVPKYVYLTKADNRILLDIHHPLHLEEIFSQLNKLKEQEQLTLIEKEEQTLGSWSKNRLDEPYIVEFVFPVLKKHKDVESRLPKDSNKIRIGSLNTNSSLIKKVPGSEWLYVKLYGNHSREEEFLGWHLNNFSKQISKLQFIDKSFFMRYADPDPHIRFRINGNPQQLMSEVMPALHKWSNDLVNEGLLNRLEISTYEREVERYGGPELIDLAEAIFNQDSKIVYEMVYLNRTGQLGLDLDIVATISVLHYLESFGLEFVEQLDWFNQMVKFKDYIKEFREHRNTLVKIGNAEDNWDLLRKSTQGEEIYRLLNERNAAVSQFIKQMKYTFENGELYNDVSDIFGSIIHLHLNRLLGIDRQRESRIMAYTRHTLHNLRYVRGGIK